MKTIIIIAILIVVCYFAFKSLFRTLTGKQGCSCSSSQKRNCPAKDMCGDKK